MARIIMTYALARAAGQDAANRNMRKAGRKVWNVEDYNLADETFGRLFPVEVQFPFMRQEVTSDAESQTQD